PKSAIADLGGHDPRASRGIAAPEAVARLCSHLRCDAPQHEGEHRRWRFGQMKPYGGRTNLRLWETIAGADPLLPDCYLQWTAQLQRVEPRVRGNSDPWAVSAHAERGRQPNLRQSAGGGVRPTQPGGGIPIRFGGPACVTLGAQKKPPAGCPA